MQINLDLIHQHFYLIALDKNKPVCKCYLGSGFFV